MGGGWDELQWVVWGVSSLWWWSVVSPVLRLSSFRLFCVYGTILHMGRRGVVYSGPTVVGGVWCGVCHLSGVVSGTQIVVVSLFFLYTNILHMRGEDERRGESGVYDWREW